MSPNYATIMVALDGSATAERAIPLAVMIARRSGPSARIELVHVHDVGVLVANTVMLDSRWEDERAAEMESAVRAVADRVTRETGLVVGAVTLRGVAARSIVQHATEQAADLIVMTTHGRSGFSHMWFGSVAEDVIHTAATPILVVGSGEHTTAAVVEPLFQHVLLPIDAEHSGTEALQRAIALGTPGRTMYTLMTVVPLLPLMPQPFVTPELFVEQGDLDARLSDSKVLLERIAASVRGSGAVVQVRVVPHDRAAPAILEVAEAGIDLIVLPVHSRSALSRTLLGSVVDKVMRGAKVPLLLFRASTVSSRTDLDAA